MERLDVRGYSCPEPVLRTQALVEAGKSKFEVLVDTNVSKENVGRYLEEEGYKVAYSEEGEDFIVKAEK